MESLYMLIPLSIILVFIMGYFFWWSTKNGQFDDLKGPAHRILMDNDDSVNEPEVKETTPANKTEAVKETQNSNTPPNNPTEEQKNNE